MQGRKSPKGLSPREGNWPGTRTLVEMMVLHRAGTSAGGTGRKKDAVKVWVGLS